MTPVRFFSLSLSLLSRFFFFFFFPLVLSPVYFRRAKTSAGCRSRRASRGCSYGGRHGRRRIDAVQLDDGDDGDGAKRQVIVARIVKNGGHVGREAEEDDDRRRNEDRM